MTARRKRSSKQEATRPPESARHPDSKAGTQGRVPQPGEAAEARARRALQIVRRLRERYSNVKIPLRHRTPLQLLIATILSAQSTDAQVNSVTPALFERYRTAEEFAGARREELERLIYSTGFYHAKARAIQSAARALLERHSGEVPKTMDELVRLPGVGRKTANVVLSRFGVPGIVVDTHVRRLSRRMALTAHDHPEKIERDLMEVIPQEEWSTFSLRLIYFGRQVCTARRPQCPACPLLDLCPSGRYMGSPPWMARPNGAGARRARGSLAGAPRFRPAAGRAARQAAGGHAPPPRRTGGRGR